jgi:hypothetical protein
MCVNAPQAERRISTDGAIVQDDLRNIATARTALGAHRELTQSAAHDVGQHTIQPDRTEHETEDAERTE